MFCWCMSLLEPIAHYRKEAEKLRLPPFSHYWLDLILVASRVIFPSESLYQMLRVYTSNKFVVGNHLMWKLELG